MAAGVTADGVLVVGVTAVGIAAEGKTKGLACRGFCPVDAISAGRAGRTMNGEGGSISTAAWP